MHNILFQTNLLELVKIFEERGEQWHRIKDSFKAAIIQQWYLMGVSNKELDVLTKKINEMTDEELLTDLLKYSQGEKPN